MSGAAHGIVGDDSYGIDLPETVVPDTDLTEEKNMAKFSRTKEFKRLKDHCEQRIAFYQSFLPDGRVVGSTMPDGKDWVVANTVIAEFKQLIAAYEQAGEAVKDATG